MLTFLRIPFRCSFIALVCFAASSASAQTLRSNNNEVAKAFNLAVQIVKENTHDGILAAGGDYGSEWTRDIAINSWNAVSMLFPQTTEQSMWKVTNNKKTIGHQYWDKIIWVTAALNHYNVTGDKDFLKAAYKCGANSIEELERTEFDSLYGLFKGPSVFNDGIAGYPSPIYDSTNKSSYVLDHPNSKNIKCLSTNCIYYAAYKALAVMNELLDGSKEDRSSFLRKGVTLKANILKHFYNKTNNSFDYLIDGNGAVAHYQEGLGLSFAVIFGIVDGAQARQLIANAHRSAYGITSIYPDFPRYSPEKPGRHNNIIWPMVNGFYAKAAIDTKDYAQFNHELKSLTHLAIDSDKGNGDFKEIYNPYNGKPYGGWQSDQLTNSCKQQTWSATAYMNMVMYGLVGLRFNVDRTLSFQSYLPEGISELSLDGIRYGNGVLNVTLSGSGNKVKKMTVNGVTQKGSNSIKIPQSGTLNVGISLE
jgi:hypothetical protein